MMIFKGKRMKQIILLLLLVSFGNANLQERKPRPVPTPEPVSIDTHQYITKNFITPQVHAVRYSHRKSNNILAKIDISQQRMKVYQGSKLLYSWKVSTGKKGFSTPTGHYKPKRMQKMHYSKKYNNAPMPYSVFFRGGYAVHGTKSIKRLGRRASHGCVRLHTRHAKKLYSLIHQVGKKNSSIKIVH